MLLKGIGNSIQSDDEYCLRGNQIFSEVENVDDLTIYGKTNEDFLSRNEAEEVDLSWLLEVYPMIQMG